MGLAMRPPPNTSALNKAAIGLQSNSWNSITSLNWSIDQSICQSAGFSLRIASLIRLLTARQIKQQS